MTLQNNEKFKEELATGLKTDMRNLTSFDLSNLKFQKFPFSWTPFDKNI